MACSRKISQRLDPVAGAEDRAGVGVEIGVGVEVELGVRNPRLVFLVLMPRCDDVEMDVYTLPSPPSSPIL